MIIHVIKKEVLQNFLSLRFSITSVICLLVVTASIAILGREYVDDLYDYTRNTSTYRKEIEDNKDPTDIIYRGVTVGKPVSRMSIFNKGIEDTGRSAKISGTKEPEYYTKKSENPINHLFPSMDLVFFVAIIMSLMAIVFSYDAISGEKYNETLKLMVSYPVSRDGIIIGKWIGGFVCLMLPFVLSATVGFIILVVLVPDISFSVENMIKICFLMVLSGIFVSIIYTFGIMISAMTERPSTSITVLLLIWVVFILVIPNLSASIAAYLSDAVNIQEIEAKKRKAVHDAHRNYRKRMREYRRENNLGWRDPEFRVYRRKLAKERFNDTRRELENINRNFRLSMQKQMKRTKWISRLSPLASFKYIAGIITGTGYREDYNFRKAVEEYNREMMEFCYGEWVEQEIDRMRVTKGLQSERTWEFEPAEAPVFDYGNWKTDQFTSDIASGLMDLGLMVCWNVLFFITAYVSFIKYDVK